MKITFQPYRTLFGTGVAFYHDDHGLGQREVLLTDDFGNAVRFDLTQAALHLALHDTQ